jgi:hypothetical protein
VSLCYDGNVMMVRTQVVLDPEVQRAARRKADQLGISFAEYLRRLVANDLGTTQADVDPSRVFDLGSSGGADVGREKDRMIGDALVAEHSRRRYGDP